MSIVYQYENKSEKFPLFGKVEDSYAHNCFQRFFHQVCQPLRLRYSHDDIFGVIDRVAKRKVYFHVFYNGMEMGELNETPLYCFWILKICLFSSMTKSNSVANAEAAIAVFLNGVTHIAATKNMSCTLTTDAIQHFYYAFRYRDLSKDPIMALAESCIVPKQ